jgi:hypothetical protein
MNVVSNIAIMRDRGVEYNLSNPKISTAIKNVDNFFDFLFAFVVNYFKHTHTHTHTHTGAAYYTL